MQRMHGFPRSMILNGWFSISWFPWEWDVAWKKSKTAPTVTSSHHFHIKWQGMGWLMITRQFYFPTWRIIIISDSYEPTDHANLEHCAICRCGSHDTQCFLLITKARMMKKFSWDLPSGKHTFILLRKITILMEKSAISMVMFNA